MPLAKLRRKTIQLKGMLGIVSVQVAIKSSSTTEEGEKGSMEEKLVMLCKPTGFSELDIYLQNTFCELTYLFLTK